jgi:hypothetical protein
MTTWSAPQVSTRQIAQLVAGEDDGVEIELLDVFAGRLGDHRAAIVAPVIGVVEAARIGRHIAATLGDADF